MKVEILDEPELEFAANIRHIDIRYGLMNAGPLDVLNPRLRTIAVGVAGTTATLEEFGNWLERCRGEIPAKESPYPNLFPYFPGFQPDTTFRSTVLLEARTQRAVRQRDLDQLTKGRRRSNQLVNAAVELFLDEMRYIAETAKPDVLVCAPPLDLMEVVKSDEMERDGEGEEENEASGVAQHEFHDLLKARAIALRVPVQLVWPHTYNPGKRRRQKRRPDRARGQQDEATRAWNLHSALYYKAGGVPWRLVRDSSQLATCCVGISFYKTLGGDRLLTSMAQVFNERGEGVVVRGGQASVSKEDRQPHLNAADAEALLAGALATYRKEHRNLPARVVLHKTSRYNDAERAGFRAAVEQVGVDGVDLLSLGDSFTRLYREGEYPPLRGTLLTLDDATHVLYTKGTVDFFRMYPGLYVPLPLLFRCEDTEQTPRFLGSELLGLTKMNWNSTQFDGRDPITTRVADQVGAILRYIGEHDPVEPLYSYYM